MFFINTLTYSANNTQLPTSSSLENKSIYLSIKSMIIFDCTQLFYAILYLKLNLVLMLNNICFTLLVLRNSLVVVFSYIIDDSLYLVPSLTSHHHNLYSCDAPWIWLLRGWGRCLEVTLQTRAAENFRQCQRGAEGSKTSDMTSEGLGEMFECDSADTCAEKFPLVSMGGRVEGLMCADPGTRTPIGASGN